MGSTLSGRPRGWAGWVFGCCLACSQRSEQDPECKPPDTEAVVMRETSALVRSQTDTSCRLFEDASVTAPCLPRCSAATRRAFYACQPSSGCESSRLDEDATSPLVVGNVVLDCAGCVNRAREACQFRVCPASAQAAFACRVASSNCSAQITALTQCLNAQQLRLEACLLATEESCFAR